MEKNDSSYIFLLTLFVCHGVLVSWDSAFFSNYIPIQRLCIMAGLGLLFSHIRVMLDEKYRITNILIGLTCASVLISTWINRNQYECSIGVGVVFALKLLLLIWYCEYLDLTENTYYGIWCLFAMVLAYCVASDVLAIAAPHRTFYFWGEYVDKFLVGNKFTLSYLHLLCLTLYCTLINGNYVEKRKQIVALVLLSFFASAYSECSTMVIGTAAMVLLLIFKDKVLRYFQNPAFFLVYLAGASTLLLAGMAILQIPAIKYLIEELLHESTDLTGRGGIYEKIGTILNISPIFGVGIDNNYVISMKYVSAADVQNGILDVFLSYGWVGVAVLLLFLVYVIRCSRRDDQPTLLMALYVYVTMASVEITFREEMYVMVMFIILFSWCGKREDIPEEPEKARLPEFEEEGDGIEEITVCDDHAL